MSVTVTYLGPVDRLDGTETYVVPREDDEVRFDKDSPTADVSVALAEQLARTRGQRFELESDDQDVLDRLERARGDSEVAEAASAEPVPGYDDWTVADVQKHLQANPDDRDRIVAYEETRGTPRKGILEWEATDAG